MAMEVTDLPEPDSPTMPRVLPGYRSKFMPRTACTVPASEAKLTARETEVLGERAYPSVSGIPGPVDLAYILLNTGQVEGVAPVGPLGWDRVTDVRAGASAYEVVVTYAGVDPDWAQPLVPGPLRASTVASADAFAWASHRDAHYAAPFLVAHVDQAQGLVTLERNPLWWGDRPKLDTIMFRTVQAEAVAAAFQHNELDVWETGTSVDRLQQSRAAADTTLRTAPGTHGRSLLVSRAGLLADAALRRAVLMAIDRAEKAGR